MTFGIVKVKGAHRRNTPRASTWVAKLWPLWAGRNAGSIDRIGWLVWEYG